MHQGRGRFSMLIMSEVPTVAPRQRARMFAQSRTSAVRVSQKGACPKAIRLDVSRWCSSRNSRKLLGVFHLPVATNCKFSFPGLAIAQAKRRRRQRAGLRLSSMKFSYAVPDSGSDGEVDNRANRRSRKAKGKQGVINKTGVKR